MAKTHAFELLTKNASETPVDFDVAAVFGSDATLKSWCTTRLTGRADVTDVDGQTARWMDLNDELSTASLFDMGEKRTLVVRDADKFVSNHRTELEAFLGKSGSAARLVLQLESLASNTKVYKSIDKSHLLVNCSGEPGKKSGVTAAVRRKFLTGFVADRHQTKLANQAADALVEMLGDDIGFLDTEIAKLSLYLPPGETIDETMVRDIVAGWQGKTVWQITEAIASGDAAEALKQLDKLIAGGQPAIALLPQIAWSLRRLGLATAAHLQAERSGRRRRLEDSLASAGITRPHEITRAIADMKRMKRAKASQLLPWLLDADLRLKGTHSADGRDRFLLEQFVMRLAST
ncbi:DNA polymerase III subunit delta [Roseiconus nitratireducens]|uniref:DNA-directed DNA polymerase n=1 Tax=Roseiconus nitratireducens TaxID=2605748 RepID=A0A5M6DAE0_9BACT|nr:DNA polymerase III subunit delta [Roseiconus nitratireducens]KAA5544501.1 DNA polymerase III subunit delta [Roseiconus nitratireducens]